MVDIVIVSHSYQLANGIVELNKQMCKDANIYACGGLEDNSLGTSIDKIMTVINNIPSDHEILILCDIGSSLMSAESAIDFCDVEDRCYLSKAALVEGSLVACVSASMEKNLTEIKADLNDMILEK